MPFIASLLTLFCLGSPKRTHVVCLSVYWEIRDVVSSSFGKVIPTQAILHAPALAPATPGVPPPSPPPTLSMSARLALKC